MKTPFQSLVRYRSVLPTNMYTNKIYIIFLKYLVTNTNSKPPSPIINHRIYSYREDGFYEYDHTGYIMISISH